MKTKLRYMENPVAAASTRPQNHRSQFIGKNLQMEDEEGEVFNNTYLTDMKNGGKFSPPTERDSVRWSELQTRNSMCLPHMRSTYTAQYADQDVREEDIKVSDIEKTFVIPSEKSKVKKLRFNETLSVRKILRFED